MNLTLKDSSWMSTFREKDINHPLINYNSNTKEDMNSPKSMIYTVFTRMVMMTPTMDSLALKFNFRMVQGTHGSENY